MAVPAEVEKLVRESGNNFHAKVARWLVGDGWHIRVSPYYMDQSQSKAREIDLIAEKVFEIVGPFGRWYADLVVRLFIECKFIQGSAVFWLSDKDVDAAMRLVCKLGGGFKQTNTYTKQHHYLAQGKRVAKLFATAKSAEQDPFYKAINQVLNAQVCMQGQPAAVLARDGGGRIKGVMNYPIIVCSSFDSTYAADFLSEAEPVPLRENFQLEVQYAYSDRSGNSRDDYFLIDVVEFGQLQALSAAVDRDAAAACELLAPS